MPSDLWYFPHAYDFCESIVGSGLVAPLPPATVLYRAVYVGEDGNWGAALGQARQRLSTDNFQSREDIYILRPNISTDGVPFRAAWIYRLAQHTEVERLGDPRLPIPLRVEIRREHATRYQAL